MVELDDAAALVVASARGAGTGIDRGYTVRPMPGKEAEYAHEASALDDSDPSFVPLVFDPPLE